MNNYAKSREKLSEVKARQLLLNSDPPSELSLSQVPKDKLISKDTPTSIPPTFQGVTNDLPMLGYWDLKEETVR